jgi:teichuronic acid biosynthesis glycosyltransferase TuaG
MANEDPLISVIIPNRNRTEVLYRAVKSLIDQSYKNWEIIIVDDSDEIIFQEIDGKYKAMQNIHVYRGDRKGPAPAQCKGFALSKGEFVAFLDSDDYWDAKKLKKHVAMLLGHSDIALSWDNLYVEMLNGEKIKIKPFNFHCGSDVIPPEVILKELIKENFIHMSCGVIRRDAITAVHGPFMDSPFDYVLWINLATRYPFAHLQEYFTTKTERLDSLGFNKRILFMENWNITRLKVKVLLGNHNEFSIGELVMSLIRTTIMSVGIHLLLPQNLRKFLRPILFLRE